MSDYKKKNKAIIRKTLTQLNKVYAPLRKRFGVKLGLRLDGNYAEVHCIDKENNKLVFGADVNIQRVIKHTSKDERVTSIEMNHGSLGVYNPQANTNGATLGLLIAITIMKWDKLEPLFQATFQEYEETFPRH